MHTRRDRQTDGWPEHRVPTKTASLRNRPPQSVSQPIINGAKMKMLPSWITLQALRYIFFHPSAAAPPPAPHQQQQQQRKTILQPRHGHPSLPLLSQSRQPSSQPASQPATQKQCVCACTPQHKQDRHHDARKRPGENTSSQSVVCLYAPPKHPSFLVYTDTSTHTPTHTHTHAHTHEYKQSAGQSIDQSMILRHARLRTAWEKGRRGGKGGEGTRKRHVTPCMYKC